MKRKWKRCKTRKTKMLSMKRNIENKGNARIEEDRKGKKENHRRKNSIDKIKRERLRKIRRRN